MHYYKQVVMIRNFLTTLLIISLECNLPHGNIDNVKLLPIGLGNKQFDTIMTSLISNFICKFTFYEPENCFGQSVLTPRSIYIVC